MSKISKLNSLQQQSVSVVIPAFNEENYIAECLEALTSQTVRPYEIIVVNNGSIDRTSDIIRNYPNVRLVDEHTPGTFAAQQAGFNSAKGEIIARTDADSRPEQDWVARIIGAMQDPRVSAVTGPFYYYDMPAKRLTRFFERNGRKLIAGVSGDKSFLAGANMAVRRRDWQLVSRGLCQLHAVHEDLDLAIHLQERGKKIVFDPDIVVATSARRMNTKFLDFYSYIRGMETVYLKHNVKNTLILKTPLFTYVPLQPLVRLLFICYNARLAKLTSRVFVALFSDI